MMRVVKNARVPLRDGVRLAADLYLPAEVDEGARFPVMLEYLPYRKDDSPTGSRFYQDLVAAGYVVARVDIRGTGGSEGKSVDEYTVEEQLDGVDTIQWLANQAYCDGQVNMMGISYGGFTALQVASHAPPALRSIIPIDFTHDRYTDDCHYRGGLLAMYYDPAYYGSAMITKNALPPDPDLGEDWSRIWTEHLQHNQPWLLEWLRHQTDSSYWRNGSVGDIADQIRCPVFMIGGWRDGYPNPPVELYGRLNVPRKLLIGPWNHAFPDTGVPGPRIDYVREVIRWLDHWCKGHPTGIMDEPPVTVYVQHGPVPVGGSDTPGSWRAEAAWPPPGVKERVLYPSDEGTLTNAPGGDGADRFTYDATVGPSGGLWSGGLPFGLPHDQRTDEARSLVYTSLALDEAVTIVGRAHVFLRIASTASVIGFVVSLSDVAPDGSSQLVVKGMRNATRRQSLANPEALPINEAVELEIPLDATAWCFSAGHRLRLTVASADFPNVWPTPEPAENVVHRGGTSSTRLILPVVPAVGSAVPPAFAPSRREPNLSPDGHGWQVIRDEVTGLTKVRTEFSRASRLSQTATVEEEYVGLSQVDPLDPAHASTQGSCRMRIDRAGGQQVESRSHTTIQGTRSHFHVTIDLHVDLDGRPYFARQWTESIPRRLL